MIIPVERISDFMRKHKRRIRKKDIIKRRILIISLIFSLTFILTIGYSAFSTNINLNAKGNITKTPSSCFNVFDNGDGTGTITDYDVDTCGTKVVIPEKINNLIITRIGDTGSATNVELFSNKNITSLIFPDTLEYIGSCSCVKLMAKNIIIPSKVKTISNHAFAWGNIETVTLPEGLETIRVGAFETNRLKSLKIPSTVKNMTESIAAGNFIEGDEAFIYARDENGNIDKSNLVSFGDRGRTEIIIPDTVETIGVYSFTGMVALEKLIIPNSVKVIKGNAFYYNPNLAEVNIGSGITYIDSTAFWGGSQLKTININRKENAITGSPWGANNATVNWTGTN